MPPKVKVEEGFGLDDAELARLEADALETMMSWERKHNPRLCVDRIMCRHRRISIVNMFLEICWILN